MNKRAANRPNRPGPVREESGAQLAARLQVGLDVFLDTIPDGLSSIRQRAVVRGWDPGNFVLLARALDKGGAYLRKDQSGTVRFFHEGEVWSFQSRVLSNTTYVDDRVIRLAWPNKAECARVHGYDRVRVRTPVRMRVEHDTVREGHILDLGAGGCRAYAKADYTVGTPVLLSFTLPGGHEVNEQLAVVRSRHHLRDGFDYGFQFRDLPVLDRTGLAVFVARDQTKLRGEDAPQRQVVICTASREDVHFAREILHPRAYEVLHAGTLLELGRLLHAGRTALLLLDSTQSPLPARVMCLALKSDDQTKDIPIAVYGDEAPPNCEPERGTFDHRFALLRDGENLLSCLT